MADEMNLGVQITGVFPGTACSAYRFQEWPAGAGPQGSGVFRIREVWPGMRWMARNRTVCEHGHATVIM
jgi:hypothetical protein